MSDDAPQDVVQVTDFHFHTCRKFRIFDAKSGITMGNAAIVRNQLATSSQLGVTLAVVSANQMVCFPTKSLLGFKVSRENMNVEVTELPMKTIKLDGVVQINDIGVNSDGTLLAVLHTNKNDVSADVYDIQKLCQHGDSNPIKPLCKTRVGLDETNQGNALEWNPAFPDTFAAASSDRSVLVVKIDVQNPSAQNLVGIGKLGAYTTTISWSPKGKQLTVGDSLGKIVQLKPNLEVVRSQFGPKEYGNVTGLCWLATTEWLVAFERAPGDQDAYLMRCKKDKPTEWIQLHELSYSSSKWPLRPQLFAAAELLVDWNVAVVGNSKTSEVAVVGKRADWQTWVPVEGEGIYLPTTSDGKDTVPIGVAVDRTMTEEVVLKPDGSQKHRPSPLVLCLTNDGVLTAHHVISTFEQHKPCQIPSQNIPIVGLSAAQSAQKSSAFTPFGALPTAKPSTIFEQKPKLETPAPAAATSNLFGKPVAPAQAPAAAPSNLFGKSAAPAPAQAPPPKTPEKVTAPTPPIEKTPEKEKPAAPEVDKKAEQLALKKKMLIEQIEKVNVARKLSREAVMKMSMSVNNAKTAVYECSDVVKCSLEDSKEVMEELKNVLSSIEWMDERTKHAVKEMDFEIEEKMELVADVADSGEKILEKLRDMSETERLMRFNKLETSADMLHGKFADCSASIKKLKGALIEREAQRKQAVLSPLRQNGDRLRMGAETEVALKVMRNVSKIIMDTRERIQRTELEFALWKREKSAIQKQTSSDVVTSSDALQNHQNISILDTEPRSHELSDSEALKARGALVARLQKRGVVKTKTIHVETYQKEQFVVPKPVELDTTSLSNAILKLSMTPRRVTSSKMPGTPSSSRRDATTQADEPPVVKTVVVTVESPAKPIQTAPTTSLPKTSTATTTSSTSPLKSSGLFGKSTFATSPLVTAPTIPIQKTSSILKQETSEKTTTSETPSEKVEKAPEAPVKEETKEEIQKTPEISKPVKEEKPEEPEKVAPVVPVKDEPIAPAPTSAPEVQKTPVEEEQKTPAPAPAPEPTTTPKAPSFSFANAAASKPATSSIFGGGLTPTASPSNIFGSKTTPPSNNSSIFGGGAKPATGSPFGSFGQPAAASATTTAATTTPTVSFSFNTAAQTAKPSFGAFGAAAPAKSAVFGASLNSTVAPSVPNVDDGMEDDSMVSGGGPGGFMSGLGGSASSGANPFAPKPASTTASSSSWLFGGGGAGQQQKPSFSFTQPTATSAPTASSSFGAAPKFGSQPVFGAKPFGGGATTGGGGGLSKNASIFGAAAGGAGGFAQFAGQKTSSMFGAAAPAQQSSSIFGGGAAQQNAPSSSIFGGGASGANANKSGSFTSWR